MQKEHARIEVNQFTSQGVQLISWDVNCSYHDHESGNRWQSSSGVIATVAEAEAFVAKLSKAIEEAKVIVAGSNAAAVNESTPCVATSP